jgi:hypothetical protein
MLVKSMYGSVEIELGQTYVDEFQGDRRTWKLIEIRQRKRGSKLWDRKGCPEVVCVPINDPRSGTKSFMDADWFAYLMLKSLEG